MPLLAQPLALRLLPPVQPDAVPPEALRPALPPAAVPSNPPDVSVRRDAKEGPLGEVAKQLEQLTAKHQQAIGEFNTKYDAPGRAARDERREEFYEDFEKALGVKDCQFRGINRLNGEKQLSIDFSPRDSRQTYAVTFKRVDDVWVYDSFTVRTRPDEKAEKPPLSKPEKLPIDKIAGLILSEDYSGRQVDKLKADPLLKQLEEVYGTLVDLEGEKQLTAFPSKRLRAERAAWYARNLQQDKTAVTRETVAGAFDEVKSLHQSYGKIPLFAGRTGLLLAHMETLPEVKVSLTGSDEPKLLSKSELTASRIRTGDDRMFGRRELVEGMRSQLGAKNLKLALAEDELEHAILKVVRTHHDVLGRWTLEEGDKKFPKPAEIAALKQDLRRVLNIPEDTKMLVTFGLRKEGEGSPLKVTVGDDVVFSCSMLTEKDGGLTDIAVTQQPKTLPPTPTEAKENGMELFRTMKPGEAGFVFSFEGHGSGTALYLSDGEPRPGGFNESKKTVRITFEEFGDALLERQKRFGTEKPDIVILDTCYSVDFARRVIEYVNKKGGESPIFICPSEYGQYSYGTLATPMSETQRAIFTPTKAPKTLGDLIDAFSKPENFRTNPTLLVPNGKKGFRQLSHRDVVQPDDGVPGLGSPNRSGATVNV